MSGNGEEEGGRRSFTDVASLFQPIVPPAGTPVRPEAPPPPPVALEPAPPPPAPLPEAPKQPAAPAAAPPPAAVTPLRPVRPAQKAAVKPIRPVPYRPPAARPVKKRRIWVWVLILPIAIAAAAAYWFIDPVQLRDYVTPYLHRIPGLGQRTAPSGTVPATPFPEPGAPVGPTTPVQPAPPPPASSAPVPAPVPLPPPLPTTPTPSAEPPPAPAGSSPTPPEPPATPVPATPSAAPAPPPPTPPAAASASSPPAPIPAAVSTSAPAAAPPSAPAAPAPPPAAAPPTPETVPLRIVIRYRKSEQNALGEGIRIAAELQSTSSQVELQAATSGYRNPTILYFRAEDRPAAEALALRLGQGTPWVVRAAQSRQKAGSLEVWVP